jgi:hypothetical protein
LATWLLRPLLLYGNAWLFHEDWLPYLYTAMQMFILSRLIKAFTQVPNVQHISQPNQLKQKMLK